MQDSFSLLLALNLNMARDPPTLGDSSASNGALRVHGKEGEK
jgi:hypothetical protein